MNRFLKYLSYFLLFIIGSGLLLLIFTQTPPFRNWLKKKIIAAAEARINGTVELRSLRGNLFTYWQIEGLSITIEGEDFLKIQRAFVRINPYAIVNKKILLSEIAIEKPELNLIQIDSTLWNVDRLLKPATTPTNADTSATFDWPIAAPNITIAGGAVNLQTLGTLPLNMPKRIRDLEMACGVWLDKGETQVALQKLTFEAQDPDLSFRTGEAKLALTHDRLRSDNLEIATAASNLSSAIDIENFSDPIVDAVIQGLPISFDEIRRALPDLHLYGDPKVVLKVRGPLSRLEVESRLWMAENDIRISGTLNLREPSYQYDLKGSITHLNLADFTDDATLASDLNLSFEINGEEFEFAKMKGTAIVSVDTSAAFGLRFEPIFTQFEIADQTITGTLQTQSRGAAADASGFVSISESFIAYQVNASITNFDVQRFIDSTAVYSDIDLTLEMDGSGTDFETMQGHVKMNVAPSNINGVPVDSANFQMRLRDKTLTLNQFAIASPLARITATGDISVHKENHLQVDAEFIDFSVLTSAMPLDSLYGCGRFSGRFEGPLDSLMLTTSIELTEFAGIDFNVGTFAANGHGVYSVDKGVRIQVDGRVDTGAVFGLTDLQSNFNLNYADSVVHFQIEAHQLDEVSATTAGELHWNPESFRIILEQLNLNLLKQSWLKTGEPTVITINENGYTISDLTLNNDQQTFFVAGKLNLESSNDLILRMQNVNLASYRAFLEEDVNLSGRMDAELLFSGNMAHPNLNGKFEVANLEYYQVPFEQFFGSFEFGSDTLSWAAVLSKVANDSLMETSGFVPTKLSLAPFEFRLLTDEQVEIKISARGLDLSFVQLFAPDVKNIKGTLVADIVLRNTLNDLRGVGPIRVFDVQFDIPTLGTQYRNVNLVLLLHEKEIVIKDFRMQSGGGELSLVGGGLALSEESLEDFKAQFRFNNFRLMNDRRMQAKVKGDFELAGSVRAPQFSGEITITESRIYYPAWFENENLVELTSQPHFILASDTTVFDTTGAIRFQKKRALAEGDFTETELYKNLRGELAIYFPRNTWIRGEDTNIEIEGELVAVKEGPEIVLFGNFVTLRGYYELFGNRFQISQGEMIFHGEPEPNPELKIEAVYEFQDASSEDRGQKHEFKVAITGTLNTPEFKFTLDDQIAEQEDILSILLFGQRKSSLSVGQAYDASSNDTDLEDRATGLVAGQLIKRLSGRLGQELSLDMIQIESGKGLTDSKIRIGKYVTPDVFVSVSQDFGAEGNRKVELEYELPKKLFFLNLLLQASVERRGSTGLDVIWKIEW
jgi:autotransporter translocation and assembly factor TamB